MIHVVVALTTVTPRAGPGLSVYSTDTYSIVISRTPLVGEQQQSQVTTAVVAVAVPPFSAEIPN